MSISYNHLKVRINLDSLAHNYRLLSTMGPCITPVIKSDGYGHGLARLTDLYAGLGAQVLAAGNIEESARIRKSSFGGRVLSLLGPVFSDDYKMCWEQGLTPFVYRIEQIAKLAEAGCGVFQGKKLDVALKFDSGMGRLGFGADDLETVVAELKKYPGLRPVMICSHLATADDPDQSQFVQEQSIVFSQIYLQLREYFPRIQASLANSAGVMAHPYTWFDLQRVGIGLYGANPLHGTRWESKGYGLRPCMRVACPVLDLHALKAGEGISYGLTYRPETDIDVAVIGLGYADNYSRSLGNKSFVLINGQKAPIVGRVCMQLSAVDISAISGTVSPGDEAVVLGDQQGEVILAQDLADWWGTIPYELFCLLGQNPREYISSFAGQG